ncbi:MAG: Thymidylate kinase (EC [uncultured Sulfurovum sp.]|uniref:Thymidylate kinase (EC) n=1 Tax=uncultured Sulfurovum sp. TaxID=269237 RepID=A0A6S6SH10_9BACT|nr:MAG: Thymidylate kinase (EC [uncultured Sulfurovum sp.]
MRNILLIAVVVLFVGYLFLSTTNTSEHKENTPKNSKEITTLKLNWGNDYNTALQIAKKEGKMVYLFIGADKCIHCDRFKEQTLSNQELIETMKEDYVLLYMSRDRDQIPNGFEKYGVPMHYFLTADGNITAHIQGSRELAGWYDVLDQVDLMSE